MVRVMYSNRLRYGVTRLVSRTFIGFELNSGRSWQQSLAVRPCPEGQWASTPRPNAVCQRSPASSGLARTLVGVVIPALATRNRKRMSLDISQGEGIQRELRARFDSNGITCR